MSNVTNTSMLVSLHQKIWQAQAADRNLAAQVEAHVAAQNNTMTLIKSLAPKEFVKPIKRIAIYGRNEHERLTLPGIMRGQQLLATKVFDEYILIQSAIRDEFEQAVRNFVEFYPEILKDAPKRLGKSFNEANFPAKESIAGYFDYQVSFAPVPDTTHWFLSDIESPDLEKLRNDLENEKNDMLRKSTKEMFDRAREVLENVASQIMKYEPGPGNGALLRDATIKSLQDMAKLVTEMNITGDPLLDAVGKDMQKEFMDLKAPELRQDNALRDKVAKAAASILAKMAA